VELRFGKEGLRAKWVRVAMRKVEMLPGGLAPGNPPDLIGQGPQTLWTAKDDHELVVSVRGLVYP
jgi:hypothetical protein